MIITDDKITSLIEQYEILLSEVREKKKKEEKNEHSRPVMVTAPGKFNEFESAFFASISMEEYYAYLREEKERYAENFLMTREVGFHRNGSVCKPEDILKRLSAKGSIEGLLEELLNREEDVRKTILSDIKKEIPMLTKARRLAVRLGDVDGRHFRDHLHKKAVSLYVRLLKDLLRIFPQKRVELLLSKNPVYAEEIIDERELRRMQEELRHNIVTCIPDNYCDLYPETRRMKRRFFLHVGPTNSGKTYSGMEALKKHKNGVYLAPLRMLALEKFDELNAAGCPCDLRTGEEEKSVPNARFMASTVEMADLDTVYDCAVIDEAQMITDPYRGGAWTAAILGLRAREIHLCMSPWAEKILEDIIDQCGDKRKTVVHTRDTELIAETEPFYLPMSVRPHDALIVFSRKSVHAVAAILENKGIACSVIYGGLPYDVRQNEAERFRRGETKIAVCTDAVGMGLNLPIQRIVFLEGEKFDGKDHRELTDEEIRQIAGRAGRRGLFNQGYVTSSSRAWNRRIRYALEVRKPQRISPAIGFPEPLLGIERPVSRLMEEWQRMPPSGVFAKEDLSEEIELARMAEKLTSDRRMVYRLAMIPVDSKNRVAMEVWQELSGEAVRGTLEKLTLYTPSVHKELGDLETMFHVWDVYSQFGRVFGLEKMKQKAAEVKTLISAAIIEKLREGGKEPRRCTRCGRALPWNYKFGVCEWCHDEMYYDHMQ